MTMGARTSARPRQFRHLAVRFNDGHRGLPPLHMGDPQVEDGHLTLVDFHLIKHGPWTPRIAKLAELSSSILQMHRAGVGRPFLRARASAGHFRAQEVRKFASDRARFDKCRRLHECAAAALAPGSPTNLFTVG